MSCSRQLWGLPSCLEYLSQQGKLLPRVYSTIASPLWIELQAPAGWQATPCRAVCQLACHRLLQWLQVTPGDVCHGPRCSLAGLGPVALEYRSRHWPGGSPGSLQCVRPWWCGSLRPVPAALGACTFPVSSVTWRLFTGVCAICLPCAVSVATWRLFTGARAVCGMCVLLVAL